MSNTPSALEQMREGSVAVMKFKFYTARDFPDLPEMEWRIDDILPACEALIGWTRK